MSERSEQEYDDWDHLSQDELRGADYALRLIHTSPTIKGRALEVVKEQQAAVVATYNRKAKADPGSSSPDATCEEDA